MLKKISKDSLVLTLKEAVYPLEAIYGASYGFIDRAYLFLDSRDRSIEVTLKPKEKMTVKQTEALAGEFMNELLNYAIRLSLSKENKKIRQYIVERALFSAVKVDETCQEKDGMADMGYSSEEDPLGIAVPWEEKYGQTDKKINTKH